MHGLEAAMAIYPIHRGGCRCAGSSSLVHHRMLRMAWRMLSLGEVRRFACGHSLIVRGCIAVCGDRMQSHRIIVYGGVDVCGIVPQWKFAP